MHAVLSYNAHGNKRRYFSSVPTDVVALSSVLLRVSGPEAVGLSSEHTVAGVNHTCRTDGLLCKRQN